MSGKRLICCCLWLCLASATVWGEGEEDLRARSANLQPEKVAADLERLMVPAALAALAVQSVLVPEQYGRGQRSFQESVELVRKFLDESFSPRYSEVQRAAAVGCVAYYLGAHGAQWRHETEQILSRSRGRGVAWLTDLFGVSLALGMTSVGAAGIALPSLLQVLETGIWNWDSGQSLALGLVTLGGLSLSWSSLVRLLQNLRHRFPNRARAGAELAQSVADECYKSLALAEFDEL